MYSTCTCIYMYVCIYLCTPEVTRLFCVYIHTKLNCSTIQNVYIYIKLRGFVVSCVAYVHTYVRTRLCENIYNYT